MARRPRRPPYRKGDYYHLYNRGRSRLPIFHEPTNYRFVLRKLKKYVRELRISIIAYCLMPNHYHFLVRQDGEQAAGLLPQRIFNAYSKAYNHRYHHSGTLFQGPYKVRHVDSEPYLRHLCRYIHANPVKDGVVAAVEQWPYSNYLEWVGLRAGSLYDPLFVQSHFADSSEYEAFLLDYLQHKRLATELAYLRGPEER